MGLRFLGLLFGLTAKEGRRLLVLQQGHGDHTGDHDEDDGYVNRFHPPTGDDKQGQTKYQKECCQTRGSVLNIAQGWQAKSGRLSASHFEIRAPKLEIRCDISFNTFPTSPRWEG